MLWIIGFLCAFVVSVAAYIKKSLTISGALAATIMGMVYFAAGNLFWFGILLVFFVSSSLLSKFRQSHKAELEKSYAKTGRRDAGQVLANGGFGMFLCILNAIWPHPAWAYLFIGIMGTVTADTWATEIGSLSKRPPRSILNGKVQSIGTSGGVSLLGSGAAAVGGVMIGGFAGIFAAITASDFQLQSLVVWVILGFVSGLVGAFTDSILGATVQVMYVCPVCDKEVEVLSHCEQTTKQCRGWIWMTNDAVNMWSSIVGAVVAVMIGLGLGL
ncbi:DUF92 domain-containing protein [Paenibacillus crassostreae]|uniref:Transmenbrane protein n=1 Tax=Paenibacillus crassostreae TaxID=1763538 RepID=A0A167FXR9_9BACL|nr:DUF92 domain-containing protein [Paenibacillus crassostreae]AOZ93962.1 hypothetical protein LPB68_18400 [Paenibacillus crassostreae]OAB77005.1 hypothetical protein PNBC_06340 [Paenibacillus crassostreae]